MSGQPDAPRVPGGTDAVETSLGRGDELARDGQAARVEEAGAVPGAGADGVATGPGAAGASAGNGPDPGVNPAGILPNTSIRLAGTRPDAEADAAAAAAGRARSRALAARLATGWPLRRIFGIGVLIAALFAVLAITLGGAALASLAGARDRVVGKIDPAAFRTSQLGIAFLNQETGVRGYALNAQRTFLKPYVQGLAQQQQEVSALRRLLTGMPAASADLAQVIATAEQFRGDAQRDMHRHRDRSGDRPGRPRVRSRTIRDPAAVPACRRRPQGGRR